MFMKRGRKTRDKTAPKNGLKGQDGTVEGIQKTNAPDVDPRVPPLTNNLKNPCGLVRADAAHKLGDVGDIAAAPALIEALSDVDENVRKNAAEALKKIGKERIASSLNRSLKHSAECVREYAAHALEKIREL